MILIADVLSGGVGSAVAQSADVDLAYSCQFPSGAQRVAVRVRASLPAKAAIGQAVSPGRPTVTVTVPRAAFGDLTKHDAASVGATEKLTVNAAQSGASTATAWRGLVAAQTALPPDGDLVLKASGVAQAVRPAASGRVVFAAGPLAVDLAPRKADGTATSPSVISLSCAPAGGADTTIATVAISDDVPEPPSAGRPGATQHAAVQAASGDDICPSLPTPDFNEKFPPPPIPPGVTPITVPDLLTKGCANVEGLSNVKKLDGASPLGGIVSILQVQQNTDSGPGNFNRFEDVSLAHLELRRATLLTFGFVPVSATLEITQLGNMNIFVTAKQRDTIPPTPIPTIAQGEVSLRLTDARVNGVPLNLGSHCRSARPVELTLHGSTGNDPPYRVTLGGRLTGEITIPAFSGCGVGEDLDPLLTASVSGPGNLVQISQGPLCQPPSLGGFPDPSRPCPPVAFGYDVDPGGLWTATASGGLNVTIFSNALATVSCGSVAMKGSLRSGAGANPTPLGQITDLSTGNCLGTDQPLNGPLTITPVDLPWKIDVDSFDPATGIVAGHFEGEKLRVSTEGCSFDITDPVATPTAANAPFSYTKPTLSLPSGSLLFTSNVDGCDGSITNDGLVLFNSPLNLSFNPPQTITQPR